MRYLDIRLLLSEEEKINCVLRRDAPELGFLDPHGRSPDLVAKSRVVIPYWLAESMEESQLAELEMPKYLNSKMKEAVLAGPLAVNLRSFSFHFFEMGLRLSKLPGGNHLKELRVAFCGERYKALVDVALAE